MTAPEPDRRESQASQPVLRVDPIVKLRQITDQLHRDKSAERVTVRSFLAWFDAQRRGYYKVQSIREALKSAGLITDPDFASTYIDSEISFAVAPGQHAPSTGAVSAENGLHIVPAVSIIDGQITAATSALLSGGMADPTYRIGRFAAANNPPVSVKPGGSLKEAITLMLSGDFSQLPVMQNERTVKGVVSWSSIGARLALGCGGDAVSDFMEVHREISADESFFTSIPTIVEAQYVLIRGVDNTITGIVTTSDLSLEFKQLAEPFLLLGEIENHIRRLIDGKYTAEQVKAARDPSDDAPVESVADLTFGSYVRLLQNADNWSRLDLAVDQTTFVKELDHVRTIRNDVMHFDPDPLDQDDLRTLRRFLRLLETLQDMGAT